LLSPDGRWSWDGSAWLAVPAVDAVPVPGGGVARVPPAGGRHIPTPPPRRTSRPLIAPRGYTATPPRQTPGPRSRAVMSHTAAVAIARRDVLPWRMVPCAPCRSGAAEPPDVDRARRGAALHGVALGEHAPVQRVV